MSSFSIALRRPLVESRPSSSSRRGSRARQPGRLLGARRLTVEPLEDRRLLSAGDLDPTFGVGGKVVTDIGFCTPDAAYDVTVVVQAGDKTLVAGNTQRDVTGYDFLLLRYNADGILDTTFGTGGMVFTDFGSQSDYAYALTVQSDGKIVVAGYSSQSGTDDFALARYLPDGTLDTSFSGDGKLTTAFGTSTDRAYDVAVQSDGKIVAVGYSIQSGSGTDFAVARYDASGNLDGTFDGDGKATANFTISTDQAFAVAIQSDGKIVAAGSSYQPATGTDDFALVRYNANGSLDTSFDADGKVTTHFGRGADYGQDVVLQMVDGQERILVAGYAVQAGTGNDVALARYNPNGSLDTSFDGDGRVTTDFAPAPGSTYDDRAYSVALQSDGKIVASGVSTASGNADFAVVRYLSNGALDASFDSDGRVMTNFGSNDEAWGVAIQADGKIVAVGRSSQAGTSWDVALARYQTNGSLDTSFGYDGKVTTDVGRPGSDDRGWGMATALQQDGKIVVVGQTNSFNYDFAVARYNANGSPDASFGSGGSVVTDFDIPSSEDCARGVAIQTDGKIVAIGYIYRRITSYDFALARYNPDGALDATFGTDGKVTTDMGASSADQAYGVAIQADGKIVVVGYSLRSTTYFDFAIARYNANGTLDTSFGTGGKVVTPFSTLSREDVAYDVAIQADGMIVAVGYSDQGGSKSNDFALARYTATGTLDTGFGSGGKVTTHFGYSFDYGRSVAIQPDGKIVVAGDAYQGSVNTSDFALARYNANGSLDTTFGTSGKVTTHFGYTADRAYSVALLGDGRIVAAGDAFQGTPNNYDFGLARYNSNGSLDTQFGVAGKVTTHFGNYDDYAYGGVALQADGKIVAAGYAYQGTTLKYDFALARYLNVLIPEAGGPYTGTEGSPMTFDASLSNDPGGRPLQYRWDFTNDGTWDTDWAASPTVTVTFADNFSGSVRVGVTNGTDTATDTAAVTVLNVAPTAEAGGPYTVDEGSSIPLALAGSGTDPAGENDPLVFAWDFDADGQFDDAIGANPTFDAAMLDGPATVTVTLRVSDGDGGSSTDTATIVVNNLPPTAADAGGPYAMTEGGLLPLAGSGSDPGSAADPLVFAWDFDGDGQFGETGVAAQRGDELGPNARFSAENVNGPTAVTVALRVTDRGGLFAESTAEIQVANVAPVITNVQLLPRQMEEGGWELLAVGFADPGSTDGHLVRIQWGDGTADTYWWLPYDIVRQAFYHYYADDSAGTAPDVYPIHVTVTDVDGAVAESGVFAIQERTVFNFVNDLYFDDAGVHYVDSLHAGAYTIWMPSGEDFQVLGGWHRQSPGTPMPSVGTAGETVMLARDDGQPFALKEVSLQPFELFPTQPIRLTFTGTRSDGSMLVQTIQLACSGSICLVGFTDVVSVSWQASTEAGYSPLFRFDNVVVETYTTETEDPEMGVLNVAPRITGLALDPIGAAENGTVTLAGTFVDPGTADTHRVLVDWGDGSPPTAIDLAQGDRSISAAHQYLDDGSYTVGVTVSDDDGGSDSSGRPVTVTRTVLDFAEWTYDSAHCEAYCVFQEYTNAGYSFDAPMGLRALGRFDPQYPGTTALFTNTLGPVVLTKNDGGPFTLESIDVTALGIMPRFVFAYVTFTGYRADGSTVVKSIATDGVFGFERIEFEGFTDLVSVTFQGDDQGDGWSCIYFFTNIVLEGRSNPVASPTVTVHNVAPVLTAYPGGYSMPENTTTGLWVGFQDPGPLDAHTVVVDWGDPNAPAPATFALPATSRLNTGDVFPSSTDESTLTVTSVGTQFGTVEFLVSPHTYADDGPAPGNGTPADTSHGVVTIRDDDGGEAVAAFDVTVENVAPVVTDVSSSATLDTPGAQGQPVQIGATFTDVGTLDVHEAVIDWGDGTPLQPATVSESGGSGSLTAAHVYAHGGVYQVSLTLTDDDTGIATAATTAAVVGAGVNQGVLQIVGTNGPDVVTVNATGTGLLDVHASFFADPSFRTFDLAAITRIEMWLCGGDDLGSIAGAVDLAAVLRGGSGNDHLNSGRAPSLLLGEEGNDVLLGSSGRDILIGGTGADRLVGQGEGDVLIAGTIAFDANDAALVALLDEWTSGRSLAERMDNIHNGTGPILDGTGWRLLQGITVFDDAESDDLTGCSGEDWFFFDPASDRVTDLKSYEGTN